MKRHLLLTGVFLFIQICSHAQFFFNDNCREAYQAILFLRFDDARHYIDLERKLQPLNRIPVYLENYIDFLTLFIDENPEQFRQLNKNEYTRLKFLEKADKHSPYYRFCLAQVRLQWAFTRLKFGEYITAASEIKRSSRLLEANAQEYPGFAMNYLSLGVIHTMAGLVPDQYKWLANLLGFEGSVEQGASDLRKIINFPVDDDEWKLIKTEALFYLAFIEMNLKKDRSEALKILELINRSLPDFDKKESPLLIYSRASIYMKTGLNEEAIKVLSNRPVSEEYYPFHYLDYLMGLALLNRLDKEAVQYLRKFLHEYHGMNYIKSTYQKLAWCWLLQGDEAKYQKQITLALYSGNAVVDEDKQALREAQKKEIPNVALLRARLLFDGGYYDRAFHELLDRSVKEIVTSKKDLLEYTYRLGRLYHETGNLIKATQYYEQTIRIGSGQPYYFAANAALQLGLICESAGQFIDARKYYQLCLSMHYEEYKNSLSQKAKAGLTRINREIP